MQATGLGLFIVATLLAATSAQFYGAPGGAGIRQVPRRGSVSKAVSNAYEREVDYGPVEVSNGVVNSRAVTKTNGGVRNGGTTSVARSNAITRDVDIGGLNIGGTLTRTQTRTNGAVSRGVAYDANVGNLGVGASFSPQNLRNGFGLMPQAGGGVSLGLGLLNFDLTPRAQQNSQALTQAQVNAQGKNAHTNANANSHTNTANYGGVGVTTTQSHSAAVGRTQVGRTSANTGGLNYRTRRAPAPRRPVYGGAVVRRPRRDAQYGPAIGYSRVPQQQQQPQPQQKQQQQQQPSHPAAQRWAARYPAVYVRAPVWTQNRSIYEMQRQQEASGTVLVASELADLNERAMIVPPAAAEQFDDIDETQRQGRTFSFITDFINSLTSQCVYPCTMDAYQNNRCCEAVIVAPPPPPPRPQPPAICCGGLPPPPPRPPACCGPALPAYLPPRYLPPPYLPSPPPLLPPPRRPVVVLPTGVPINCCVTCVNYNGFFGPPPCVRYGIGGAAIGTIDGSSVPAPMGSVPLGGFGGLGGSVGALGGSVGALGGSVGALGGSVGALGGSVGALGTSVGSTVMTNAGRVTIYVPPNNIFG